MKIIEKTKGKTLKYDLCGVVCSFENGDLAVDMSKEQCGSEVTVDISVDKYGKLVRGVADWYAAQLIIPAKRYTVRENGIADEMGFRQITKTASSLNTDEVTLVLWGLEAK